MFDLEKAKDYTPEIDGVMNISLYFNWYWEYRGFGQMGVEFDRETGKITIDNECLNRDSVKKILYSLVDRIVDTGELDIEPRILTDQDKHID